MSLPFEFNYTQEMSDKFNDELKKSNKCGIKNPSFYGKWELLEVGTKDYKTEFSKKRTKK